MAPRRTDIRERLERQLTADPVTDCLLWAGPVSHNGYGRIRLSGAGSARGMAHRIAYELAHGPIPDGLQIDHLCRNRRCCNPAHLEAVTGRENWMRGCAPSAANAQKTHCKFGHEFTPENTKVYRGKKRICRQCRAIINRANVLQRRGLVEPGGCAPIVMIGSAV